MRMSSAFFFHAVKTTPTLPDGFVSCRLSSPPSVPTPNSSAKALRFSDVMLKRKPMSTRHRQLGVHAPYAYTPLNDRWSSTLTAAALGVVPSAMTDPSGGTV